MTGLRLRHALRADLPDVASVWVDAFAGDPYLRWLVPDDAAWPDFGSAWMTMVAELCFDRGHTYLADSRDLAIAWIPPDLTFIGPDDVTRAHGILAEHAGQARADQALATILSAREHVMTESHWTLQYIGVRASRVGTGLGAAAVAPILRVCDDEAMPCALVSTNPRNLSFYERHGFSVDAEVWTPDESVALRPMRRMPSA